MERAERERVGQHPYFLCGGYGPEAISAGTTNFTLSSRVAFGSFG